MTISKKKLIEEVLSKGGLASSEREDHSKECTTISLRIPNKLMKEVNNTVKDTIGISRTGWILQAMYEKLNKK